jgi:hypothetical protein
LRHQLRPSIESLETKSLLSHMALGLIGHELARAVPAVIGAAAGAVEVSLTTDQTSYTPGQTVTMTFTETNDTGRNVLVELGPSIDGFSVTRAGQTIWRSNAGLTPDSIVLRELAPGAAITLTAAWSASSVTGTYVAHNQLDPGGPSATFEIVTGSAVAAHVGRAG